jgi:hypothetical protein
MAGFTATNDTGAIFGKIRFKTCVVSFVKNKPSDWPNDKSFKLSQLINPKFGKHKDKVICFCDGYKEIIVKKKEVVQKEEQEFEPVELESTFDNQLNIIEVEEVEEERDFIYHKDKLKWVNTFSKNPRLILGIKEGYDCDQQYCEERLIQELPGFCIIDESTFFWKNPYPTEEALLYEKTITKQLNDQKNKYGSYTRIVLLEQSGQIKYKTPIEALVIFNYLNKFDVMTTLEAQNIIKKIKEEHEQQLQCSGV